MGKWIIGLLLGAISLSAFATSHAKMTRLDIEHAVRHALDLEIEQLAERIVGVSTTRNW